MAFAALVAGIDVAVLNQLGGEAVIYRPQFGVPVASVTVTGLFDSHFVATIYGMSGEERYAPLLFLRIADLPVDPDTDEPTITIRGVDYKVRERQRDGLGGIVLNLIRTGA